MTAEQYWEGAPELAKAYREADKLKLERKNYELWLQGVYIYNAFGTVVSNAFGKKGRTKAKYLDKPIRVTPLTEEEKRIEAERAKRSVINTLNNFKKMWDRKQQKGE